MIEVTDAARRFIGDAWRRGRVLVLHRPWADYDSTLGIVSRWLRTDDEALGAYLRAGDPGIYVPPDLLPVLRRRRLRLEAHSFLGWWPGIAVRDLDLHPGRGQ